MNRRRNEISEEKENGDSRERDRERFRERQKQRDPEAQRDRRREALKKTAIEIFAERGYHATKVSDIVDEVGVAQGTFYLHFDGKEQIFEEILNDFLSLLLETVANWEPKKLDSREALRDELTRVGTRLTEIIERRQKLAAIYFTEASAERPEFGTLVRDFHEALVGMLSQFNRILHDRGLIATAQYEILANMTIGTVERIIREYVIHGEFEDVSNEVLVDHLVVHYLSGTTEPMVDS